MRRSVRKTAVWVALAAALAAGPGAAQAEDVPVDLELILAVDVSQSVDPREGQLQRLGYITAITDPRVVAAIEGGAHGRIAVTFMEWAGPGLWRDTADWRVIANAEDAGAFARQLRSVGIARGIGTSITSAIGQALRKFEDNGFAGDRRVIDISGDGPNSSGGLVTRARDAAVAAGVTINGLPINNDDGSPFTLPDLDLYYRDCVIGGPGSFIVPVDGFEAFAEAVMRKLILEIASEPLPVLDPPVIRVQAGGGLPPDERPPKYAPECDIGERQRILDNPALNLEDLLRGRDR